MAGLNEKIKQQAIKAFIEKISIGGFDPSVILHSKFNTHLKKYPSLMYDAYFFLLTDGISRLVLCMCDRS